jgi:hypothetical protein
LYAFHFNNLSAIVDPRKVGKCAISIQSPIEPDSAIILSLKKFKISNLSCKEAVANVSEKGSPFLSEENIPFIDNLQVLGSSKDLIAFVSSPTLIYIL